MKSSEVLRAALERMDGGRKWHKNGFCGPDNSVCASQALYEINPKIAWGENNKTYERLRVIGGRQTVSKWNDSAPDFSVIEKGFRAAIEWAIAEGD